ncbi:MAG TPA: hypothetical protein VFT84_12160 [Gemmatimonadales bacterium]|nr:hypothetical protein [Gemmatimonadales bacterium]
MFIAVRAALPLVAALAAASCGEADPPSAPEDTAPATPSADSTGAPDTLAAADSLVPAAAVSYSGIPFGPYGLYANVTEFEWGPAPFTASLDNTFAGSIERRIAAARQQHHRLVLAMTGGTREYITSGKFDMAKWKARMNTFNTAAIKKAVADAVADGTVVGNKLIDEPESPQWGGVLTKPKIDQMAAYVKNMFPTLPVGVTFGAPGYRWRTSERYKVVDWAGAQYVWNFNRGDITAWRDAVLSWAKAEGVTPVFSLNILDGGVPDKDGTWDCTGTGGKGTRSQRCRMTADQVRTYGRAIGPYGCAMLMWRYDDAFMSKSANQSAFRDVASLLNSKPRRSCRRP